MQRSFMVKKKNKSKNESDRLAGHCARLQKPKYIQSSCFFSINNRKAFSFVYGLLRFLTLILKDSPFLTSYHGKRTIRQTNNLEKRKRLAWISLSQTIYPRRRIMYLNYIPFVAWIWKALKVLFSQGILWQKSIVVRED